MNPLDKHMVRAARDGHARTGEALRLLESGGPHRYNLARAILEASKHGHADALTGYEGERNVEMRNRLTLSGARASLDRGMPRNIILGGTDLAPYVTRADTVAAASTGGYLVETVNAGYIELARARSVTMSLGATVLDGLVGNVNLPRVAAALSTSWLSTETTAPSDQAHTFGQIALAPHNVSINLKVSRQLLEQASPAASALIASDMLAAVGQAIDVGALGGSAASGQPTGITAVPGIGTASGSTFNNGAAIDMQGACAKRLSPYGGYAAPVTVAKLLAKRLLDATDISNYVWEGGLFTGQIAGNPAIASDNVPASTVIYGSWDQLIIASWGALEVEVSPYGNSSSDFQAGLISLRIICTLDIGVRDVGAFCVATSVT